MEIKNKNLVSKVLCLDLRQHIAPMCFFACLSLYVYFSCELCYKGFQKTLMSQVNFLQNPSIVFGNNIVAKYSLAITLQRQVDFCTARSPSLLWKFTSWSD